MMLKNMMTSFRNYARQGAGLAMGMEPVSQRAGATLFEAHMPFLSKATGVSIPKIGSGEFIQHVAEHAGNTGKMAKAGFVASGIFTGINIASSTYNEGIGAGVEAAAWDVGFNAALFRFAYTKGKAGVITGKGWGAYGGAFAGSAIGATVGQIAGSAVAGRAGATVGGFGGAYAGGAIGSGLSGLAGMKHGKMAMGGILLAGAATAVVGGEVFRGMSSIVKTGMEAPTRGRGIDTAGSMTSFMTRNAMTMRSRAVQAISKSHLNARSALGQEASLLHHPSKNYHSKYRRTY